MESLIDISRTFETQIMTRKDLPRGEYDACWEIYNSQPLYGSAYATTAQHIYRAMNLCNDGMLVDWVKSNARYLAAHNYQPLLPKHQAEWEKIQAWIA